MKRYLCLILVLAAVFLFSCSAKPDKEGAYQNFLWLNTYANPSTLNPILASDSASYAVINFVFRGLMKVNENLEIVPEMAASYTVSPDGKTYTFYLHKNITWHDGQPFTAEDVKFTFDKILDPQTKTVKRSAYIIDGQPIKFKVIDTYTIQAILPQPYAPLLTNMTAAILPKHLLEDQDINTASFNSHPVGTGPFVFKSWKNSQYITLVKNEHYYLGAPKLDGIIYKIIPNVETALLAYKKGELDIASFQPKAYAEVQKLPYTKIYQYDILYYSYLGFNLKNPLLSSRIAREAIAYAIDKPALIDATLLGFGTPAYLPNSPSSWAYSEENIIKHHYDPEKSKMLLASLGYQMNEETKIIEKDGEPFEFTFLISKDHKISEKTAQIIQQYLAQIGIKMHIQALEWTELLKKVNYPQDPKPFDAVLMGWSLGVDPDIYAMWHSSEYPKGFNFIGYQNSRVDQLLKAGRTETDKVKRKQIYHQVYQYIARDLPYYFLFYNQALVAVNTRVKGLSEPNPLGILREIEKVYLDPQ